MNKPSRRVRPLVVIVPLFLALGLLGWGLFLRPEGGPGSDRRVTRIRITQIAKELKRQSKATGHPNIPANDDLAQILFGTNAFRAHRTNVQGQVLDEWGSPYQIIVEASGTFVIRSAGRNNQFGDEDDITFDSSKGGFVKP